MIVKFTYSASDDSEAAIYLDLAGRSQPVRESES